MQHDGRSDARQCRLMAERRFKYSPRDLWMPVGSRASCRLATRHSGKAFAVCNAVAVAFGDVTVVVVQKDIVLDLRDLT